MNEIFRTDEFIAWQKKLDKRLNAKVETKIARMAMGNFGDHKQISEFVYETRIHVPSGLRLYYMWRGKEIVLMLGGGDKDTQKKDIEKAAIIAEDVRKEDERN